MKELKWASKVLLVRAVLIGGFIASLIKLPANASTKVFILLALASAYLIYEEILSVFERLLLSHAQLLHSLRKIYITLEMQRLHPDDKTPARDLLQRDLEIEKEEMSIHEQSEKAAWSTFSWVAYTVFGLCVIVITGLFLAALSLIE